MDKLLPILIIAIGIWAVVSLVRHPLTKCPKCKGTGEIRSAFFSSRYRPCPRCGRKGEIRGHFGSNTD